MSHWHIVKREKKKMRGTVKTFNVEKNYGFIKGEDGKEYFFHASAVKNGQAADVGRGVEVEFEDAEGSKGPRAEDVYLS